MRESGESQQSMMLLKELQRWNVFEQIIREKFKTDVDQMDNWTDDQRVKISQRSPSRWKDDQKIITGLQVPRTDRKRLGKAYVQPMDSIRGFDHDDDDDDDRF